ncbi:MAG: hypothetical protein IPL61_13600 [Myxococcales bacterium]|nr:hypothetical protein [Myxococcales bacterium]
MPDAAAARTPPPAARRQLAARSPGAAEVLVDMTRYREAIATYQRLLALPLDADARRRLTAARDRAVMLAR